MTLQAWGVIAQWMSGVGLITTASVAVATFRLIHVGQTRKQWADDFRALAARFWKDQDISLVRKWIISDLLYEENLQTTLMLRNAHKDNKMGYEGSIKLDKLDQFCAQIVEFQLLAARAETNEQQNLLRNIMPNEYWIKKAVSRAELREYIKNHWWEIVMPPDITDKPLPMRPSSSRTWKGKYEWSVRILAPVIGFSVVALFAAPAA